MTTYRHTEVTKRTVRYEFAAPMDAKTLGVACAVIAQEFERLKGRPPTYDNDYWLESADDSIAFVFEITTETPGGLAQ